MVYRCVKTSYFLNNTVVNKFVGKRIRKSSFFFVTTGEFCQTGQTIATPDDKAMPLHTVIAEN